MPQHRVVADADLLDVTLAVQVADPAAVAADAVAEFAPVDVAFSMAADTVADEVAATSSPVTRNV